MGRKRQPVNLRTYYTLGVVCISFISGELKIAKRGDEEEGPKQKKNSVGLQLECKKRETKTRDREERNGFPLGICSSKSGRDENPSKLRDDLTTY